MGCSSAAHSPDALPDGAVAINHPAQPRSGKKLVGRRSPRDRGGDLPVHLAHLASAPAPMHLAGALGLYAGPVHKASGPRPHPAPILPTSGPYLAHVWPTSGPRLAHVWPGVSIVSRSAFGYCPRLAPSARPALFVRCSM